MSDQLLKRIATLLKEEGFGEIATRRSTFSGTLTASQGETKVVVHVTERDELPHRSVALDRMPSAAEIRVKPSFQDIRMGSYGDLSGARGSGGSGGSPEAVQRPVQERARRLD